ncbi:MAG: vWA domain-containing protein, partial [Ignavibacteria bacterium]
MKKQKDKKIYLTLLVIALLTGLSIAAYNNIKSKAHKFYPSKIERQQKNSGPIQFSTSLDNRYYYDNNQVYLYIDLKADMAATYRERTPLNIAVVIDKSGSMGEKNKIGYVKKAVDYIIDHLDRGDYISIVTYDTDVDVLQRSTRVRDKYDLKEKVSRLQAGGWTNLSEGMFEGYDQVNDSYRRGYVNRVLLLSDGLANRGITDRWRLADMVRDRNRRDGIVISTFGVGNDFNE